jgi:hypothetical protein
MAQAVTNQSKPRQGSKARIASRIPSDLGEKLVRANEQAGLRDSVIAVAALRLFFKNHPTVSEQIDAVIRAKTLQAKGAK